jgi:hypothetical protein
LIDQTMVNDFRPFGTMMAKLSTSSKVIERDDGPDVELPIAVDHRRRIDTSYQVYLGLYQAIVRLSISKFCSKRYLWLVNNYAPYARGYYAREASGLNAQIRMGETQSRRLLESLLHKALSAA